MLWLWILGAVILLLALLCLIRVGVWISFDSAFMLQVKAGPLRIQVFPMRKKPKKKKAAKKPKEEAQPKKKKQAIPKPDLLDIKDAFQTLWPPLRKALGRTWRGIRINPLQVGITIGGAEDPAAAAGLYGDCYAGIWTVMPQLERLLDIPNPYIHLDTDFNAGGFQVRGELGISIRIGTILLVGLGIGIPAIRWFLRYRKRKKQRPPAADSAKAA